MWTKEDERKMALAAQLSNAQIDQMYNRKPGGLKPAVKLLVDRGWEVDKAESAVSRLEYAFLQVGETPGNAELEALGFITQNIDAPSDEEMKRIKAQIAPRNRRERRRMERKSKRNGKKY